MASRSRSRSPLHSEFNASNDRASPTPSHASEVSTTSNIFQTTKKYSLRMDNVPKSWGWRHVHNYVSRHTDHVDKAIAEDIVHIPIKQGTGIFLDCSIQFKTELMRNQAFHLLKQTNEKINGRKLFVHKPSAVNLSRSRSPLHSEFNASNDRASPTPSHASEVSATSNVLQTPKNYSLRMDNVPTFWNRQDVLNYVNRHTDSVDKAIAEDIAQISIKQGTGIFLNCSIQFKTEQMRNQAFELLKQTNEKVKGRKLFVHKSSARARSRSRSPLHEFNTSIDRASPTPSHASEVPATSNIFQNPKKYCLRMTNVPNTWKWHDVLTYVKKHANNVDKAIAEDITYIPLKRGTGLYLECFIEFNTEFMRDQAFEVLKRTSEKINGKKLFVSKAGDKKLNALKTPSHGKKEPALFIEDGNETYYGLSTDILRKLEITPPLTRRVLVRYLPSNYEELKIRKLFSMAGTVVSLNLLKQDLCIHALVEYDHPVEAVQAISMFHNQKMFENKIKCTMVNFDNKPCIEGMSDLGPGLGPDGTPMKGIRVSLEINKFKAEIMTEFNKMQESIDELKSLVTSLIKAQNTRRVNTPTPTTSNPSNMANPIETLSNLLTNQFQPTHLQNLVQPITGMGTLQNMTGSNMNMQADMQSDLNMQSNPNMQGCPNNQGNTNMQGGLNTQGSNMQSGPFMQTDFTNMQNMQPFGLNQQINTGIADQQYNSNTDRSEGAWNARAMVVFKDLPTSVTQPALQSKMREVGEVKFVRMTGPGRALVSFFSDKDADKCIRLFNQCKVDGQIIGVQKM